MYGLKRCSVFLLNKCLGYLKGRIHLSRPIELNVLKQKLLYPAHTNTHETTLQELIYIYTNKQCQLYN